MFYRFMGAGQFSCFPKAVLQDDPYPVRSLLLIGGSPILSYPDSNTWREAYKKARLSDRSGTQPDRGLPLC